MKLTVQTDKTYEIVIEKGAFSRLPQGIQAVSRAQKVALISDDKVFSLYGKQALELLQPYFETVVFTFPHGEASKNITVLSDILEFLAEQELDRGDCLVALGGGVVGDITGLAAALYLRGVAFVAVPTTLLAQVDSSVGGKTAIDLRAGKNLAGAFYQPSLVLCDETFLATLAPEDFRSGMAEVIKYAVGFDRALYQQLEQGIDGHLSEVIARCIQIKRDTVEQDEFDRGERQKLNLGHTFGHAIEKCSQFTLSHGDGVAIGLSLICHGYAPSIAADVDALLLRYELPIRCMYPADAVFQGLKMDKKRRGDKVSLILPSEIGVCRIQPTPLAEIAEVLGRVIR